MAKHDIAPISSSSLVPFSEQRNEPAQDSAKTNDMKADGTAFKEMAEKYGISEVQLLLRLGVQNGYAVLFKSVNPDRMRQNFDQFSFSFEDAEMAQMATMKCGDGVAWASRELSKCLLSSMSFCSKSLHGEFRGPAVAHASIVQCRIKGLD